MTEYYCSGCGLAVIVIPGQEPIKACICQAPIDAKISAVAFGIGGVK